LLPALDGVAMCAVQQKRPAEAEAAIRRALSIRESAFGPSSGEVAATLDHLGKFYYDQKKYPEAAYCYERALYIRIKVNGETSPETQASLTEVATVYGAQGRHGDAEPIFRQILTAREADTVSSMNSLAALLASREHNAEAESLYKISIAILDKKGFVTARRPVINPNDPPPPQLAETLDQYTALLKKLHKKSDAAKMEARAHILHGAPPPPEPASGARKKTK
jgi:tetratricopeptide (TPR) repeat protein